MEESLKITIESLAIDSISVERKSILKNLIQAIQVKIDNKEMINLIFVCTHNSRRSQFSQIWAQIIADYFRVYSINSYSAGTESTAVYKSVVEVMKKQSLSFKKVGDVVNPIYMFKFDNNSKTVICFSKTLDDDFNPKSEFIAVMTCSEADNGCPNIIGASHRISLPFQDPKKFDGQECELEEYEKTSLLIATEMKFVFSNLKNN